MKRLYAFSALALVGTIFLVEYDLSKRIKPKFDVAAAPKAKSIPAKPIETVAQETEVVAAAPSEDSFFDSSTLKAAQKLSSNQIDPRTLDQKMDGLAKSLSTLEIRKLAIVVRNKDESEDRRAMAVELLSRSKTSDAVLMLKDFVGSHQGTTEMTNPRKRELESVLRAQAIEGIAAYPQKQLALSYLNSLSGQVEETFLKDRIVRSEEGLKGRAPNTQHKDEAVLKQLVQ